MEIELPRFSPTSDSLPYPSYAPSLERHPSIFTVPSAVEGAAEPLEWAWVEFAVDEMVDVMVCMMYNPGEFYCHFLKDDGKLALLFCFIVFCKCINR